jgi:putative transposase
MATRKSPLRNGEFYHVYNRGVDKRTIFEDVSDGQRFLRSMIAFNNEYPIGSLLRLDRLSHQNSNTNGSGLTATVATTEEEKPLVNIIAYCLNSNHVHLLLEQVSDGGVSEFMKRLSGGYTWYFNNKYARSGSLFQGSFKSICVRSNEYLLHVSAYINLNDRVHSCSGLTATGWSSWNEYTMNPDDKQEDVICKKHDILGQFRNRSAYRKFAEQTLQGIRERRGLLTTEYLLEDFANVTVAVKPPQTIHTTQTPSP